MGREQKERFGIGQKEDNSWAFLEKTSSSSFRESSKARIYHSLSSLIQVVLSPFFSFFFLNSSLAPLNIYIYRNMITPALLSNGVSFPPLSNWTWNERASMWTVSVQSLSNFRHLQACYFFEGNYYIYFSNDSIQFVLLKYMLPFTRKGRPDP